MEYYVTQPKDYWIAPNAINITLNALGDKNRIQCSVVSGAVIMCFLEDVKPASQGGDPENGDGLYYGVNHEPKRWPLSISPTYFNTDSHKYVYVAIPRSETVGTQAVIVFPSEELDIYGRARRLLTSQETGEPLLNEDGEQQVSYEQIGSTDYFYIYLNGIISAPAVNAATGREERGWERIITDWGKLETAQGREERQNSNEWFSYSQVNQVVTFLKEIIMGVGSSFRNLILNHKNLTDVATSETDYTDSDTMVATPGYVEKHYLSKSHDDSTPYSLTVGGILRAATGYITSLYSDLVQSTNYTGDGIADTGYRLTANHNGHSKLTIDEIYVRMKAVFESLEVRERTYAGGDQIWSCAGNRINRVDYLGNAETSDHAPEMMDVHADGRPAGTGEGDVYSVPVPGDTYGYSYVKVPWLLRQMPFLLRHKFFGRLRRVRIILNEQEDVSGRRAGGADSQIGKIRRARCYFLAKDDDMEVHNWWRINDLARCQTMNLANTTRKTYLSGEDQKAGNIFWWRKVIGVSYEPVKLDDGKEYHYFDVAFDYQLEQEHPEEMATSVMEGSDIPAAQDSVVQFGNTIIEGRMNLMMMEVNGGDAVGYSPTADAPCLKAYRGVYCFDLNKCWVGGQCCKMKLSPKSGYEFYGPNFKIITEYDVVPVPIDRGLWLDIVPTRDDYREHEMVRKCYYYDKVSHNGSYWLCSIVDGAHWVDGNGDYISDAAYSALTEAQKALCSRKQNYTIEEPSADSIDWTEVVKRGEKGDNMVRLDINNEMDMIPTTAALRIDVARTVETTVRLFDGATEVDISAATLSPTGGPASSIATFSQSADGNGKKLSWAFKAGQTMAEAYDITISYTYKNVAYTAVFTVSASKGEAVWQLKPSLSAIPFQRNADNTLTPASRAVGLSLVKIDGGSTATYTSVQTGLTVRYSTSSMPSSASAGTGWESGNITVANTDDNLYIALFNASGVLLDRETIPVVKDGENGSNVVRLDINNEMDMIPTTAALRIDVARTVETTVRLFDGATEVDISAATLSPTGAPASSIATFSQSADGKGKKLSWAFKAGQTMAEAYDITISYTYKSVAYTAVFTVSASKGEAVWQLKPSLSAIPFQRNADNTLTPASRAVGLSLVKIDGGSTATYTSVQTGLTVRYSTSSMPSSASAGTGWESGNITVDNTADNLYIALFNASGVLLDRETIPVIKDGEKGTSTEHVSVYKAQSDKPTKPTGTVVPPSGWSKVPVSDKESASLTFTYTGAWSKSGNVYTSDDIDNNGITKEKVSFSITEPVTVKVKLTASSEANYDYVLIGNPDEDSVTRTGNYKARVSGTDSIEVELEFGSAGEHFFVVAYAKDASSTSGSDNGKFEILGAYKSNAIPIWVSTSKLVNDVCDGNWSDPVRWNGKDGEAGKNGKDAAVAVFSRNPIVFQGSSLGSSVNTNSISSVIRVLDGGTEYTPTNINVDSKPSGVTVTASSGQVSVSPSQTGLSEDMLTGSIKLTLTYNGGKTVVGYLTTTVARAGEDASYDFITLHGTCHDGSSTTKGFITVQKDGTKTSMDTLGRGLTFFAVNRETLQIVTSGTLSPSLYDTYGDIAEGSSGACNSLAAKIRSCNNSYFVCLVSQDAVGWNDNLISAIREYGGMTPERTTVGRYPFVFIGVKGLSQGYALQQQGEFQSTLGAQVTAYVNDSMFSSVKQGHMGRNFYYDGVYDSSKSYKVTQYEAPFVSYNSNYWVRKGDDGTTATGQAPSTTSPYWALMTSTFKYLITEAIFSEYAKLGSWIFNGDYMFSSKDANGNTRGSQSYTGMSDTQKTSGFIPAVAMDAANGRASFSGDKVRFNPDGSGWLANKNIEWDASGNAKFKGTVTATGGEFTGEVTATSGTIGGFTIDTNRLYNSNWNAGIDINYDGKTVKIGKNAQGIMNTEDAIIRAENTKVLGGGYNTALYLNASGATYNYAFYGNGNGVLNGLVFGYKVQLYTIPSGNVDTISYLNIIGGSTIILNGSHGSGIVSIAAPKLTDVRKCLGINSSTTPFAIEFTVISHASYEHVSIIFRTANTGIEDDNYLPWLMNEDDIHLTYSDANFQIAQGDVVKILLVYDNVGTTSSPNYEYRAYDLIRRV